MDLAIIIAVHNRNDRRLENCLGTLISQDTTKDYGIFIVDYNSHDNLPQLLGQLGSDKINYLHVEKEHPFNVPCPDAHCGDIFNKAHANNIAIQAVDADIICATDGFCLFQDTLVETLCTKATEDSLLIRVTRPSYVPEPIWMDPDLGPADFEAFRQQGAEWLEQQGIAPGHKRKRLFAAKRERFMEIRGYDERLAYDEDVDVVRRLLVAGNVLVDVSDDIAMAYQPATEDRELKTTIGQLQQRDLELHEDYAAQTRKTPERNLNREWGAV